MRIESNGSKWGGEAPDPPEALIERLKTNTLDPMFEDHGNFVTMGPNNEVELFGNFFDHSHVFRIFGEWEELLEYIKAIRANQETQAYKDALALLLSNGDSITAGRFRDPDDYQEVKDPIAVTIDGIEYIIKEVVLHLNQLVWFYYGLAERDGIKFKRVFYEETIGDEKFITYSKQRKNRK